MNLFHRLQQRNEENRPLRAGLIGAGKFGSMFLAQLLRLPGVHLVGIAEINRQAARLNFVYVGWSQQRFAGAAGPDRHESH